MIKAQRQINTKNYFSTINQTNFFFFMFTISIFHSHRSICLKHLMDLISQSMFKQTWTLMSMLKWAFCLLWLHKHFFDYKTDQRIFSFSSFYDEIIQFLVSRDSSDASFFLFHFFIFFSWNLYMNVT